MDAGNPIKDYRTLNNLTQDQLGEEIGCSGVAISRYEQGQRAPRGARLRKLSEITGASIEQILALSAVREAAE